MYLKTVKKKKKVKKRMPQEKTLTTFKDMKKAMINLHSCKANPKPKVRILLIRKSVHSSIRDLGVIHLFS